MHDPIYTKLLSNITISCIQSSYSHELYMHVIYNFILNLDDEEVVKSVSFS